ncbi:mechanosensitive ion channel protein 10-like [Andrographis paniculata]|uniref:mechanosensitive ion channel protein 10-like n=1 Tax=Andrographis paniculata TaxID=175694 RepID=UPI0021E719D7|nr:mechanosensitive ion channel protein 10-like [Andrographis paniculata]
MEGGEKSSENETFVVEIQPDKIHYSQDNIGNGKSEPPPLKVQDHHHNPSMAELSMLQLALLSTTTQTHPQTSIKPPSPSPSPSSSPQIQQPSPMPPQPIRRRTSAYAKPKSRIAEPPYPFKSKPIEPQPAPPVASPKQTPKTPLTGGDNSVGGDDEEVYKTDSVRAGNKAKKGRKTKAVEVIEWSAFVTITTVLIASLTVNKLKTGFQIWGLEIHLWRWSLMVMVIFCGRLFTEWLTNALVFLIEKNFLLKKKVLYFVFGLKKSVRIVFWLALILVAWLVLINVEVDEKASRVRYYITRGIVSTLVGAVLWLLKTLLIKLIASSFHVRTYFDRIQESIFHQYILQALSGPPLLTNSSEGVSSRRSSGKLSFRRPNAGKKAKDGEVIDVDKLYKMKREKVSAWTMKGLIGVIRDSALRTVYDTIDESVDDESEEQPMAAINSEVEAREAAYRIFKNVAKEGHKYIEEDDLLRFLPKEEVENAIPLFEGAAESKRIKRSAFRNWVVKAYNERKYLAHSLTDAKTAIEELNRLASALILVVIIIVWFLLMEIATTQVLVFIASQILLVVFMFGNTAKTVFEAIIFVFIVHPFDVGDRCVVEGAQMIVDEMNILTTIFLKPDNEKVYYPNAVLATKAISNFNRSPEMMGDSVEFAVDFSTSVESIAALKSKIKVYLESKPQQWNPNHMVQMKEIVDADKMIMELYVTHTLNFQNAGERGNRRSDLVLELKRILEELRIRYHLLPQEVEVEVR